MKDTDKKKLADVSSISPLSDLLWQRANAQNVTFWISLQWPIYIVIYLDFHSTKWALWLVDSCSHAPDKIQMYPDRDTIIAQLLPARRLCLFVFAIRLFKRKSKYITKHLMYGPSGKVSRKTVSLGIIH